MSDTPSSGSGVDIASLGIQVDSTQPIKAADAMDTLTKAADGSIVAIDRLAESSAVSSKEMTQVAANTSRVAVSTEELTAAIAARSRTQVSANDVMASANATLKNKIQLLQEEWAAEQKALKDEQLALEVVNQDRAARQAFILTLQEQVKTFGMADEALLRYRASQLGATEAAEPLIASIEAMRLATEKYGVTITNVAMIEKAKADWEAANLLALGAQRRRALQEQVDLERTAQEEMMRNQTIFEAFKRRTMAENRAEAMRILTEQEEAAIRLAEKQAIEEIRWTEKSVQARIAELERLKLYQANGAIRPETIEASFSSAAIRDLPNLTRLQQEYAESVRQTTSAHGAGHAPAASLGEALGNISFQSSRARSELIVLGHEAVQGRFSRMPASMMVLMEYTNAASLAFTGMGIAALASLVAVGATLYEMAKGSAELVHFNNAIALTANYAGMTRDTFAELTHELKDNAHGAIGTTSDMLIALASSGKVSNAVIHDMGRTALQFQMLSGQSTEQVAKWFEGLGKTHGKVFNDMQNDVAEWAAKANDQYHFLSASQYEHIRLLTLQGEKQEAIKELMDAFSDSMSKHDRRVGIIVAAYRGWVMIAQDLGHALQNLGKDWFNGDSPEEAMNRERQKYEQMVEARMKAASRKLPDGSNQLDPEMMRQMDANVKSQLAKFRAAAKAYQDSIHDAAADAELAQANSEGVEAQRYLDYLRKANMTQKEIGDDMVAHAVDSAATINRNNILKWERNYKGDKAGMDAARELAIANHEIEVVTADQLAKDIENIRKKHHDRMGKAADDGRAQDLDAELKHYDAEFKAAEQATNANKKLLDDARKAGTITDETYYSTLKSDRDNELLALQANHDKQIAALQKFSGRTAVERAKIRKQIQEVNDAYNLKVQGIEGQKSNSDQDQRNDDLKKYANIMDDISKAGIKDTEQLDKQIEAQKKHNAEIGQTAEQRAAVAQRIEEEKNQQNLLDAAYMESLITQGGWDEQTTAVFTARLTWLQRSIDKHNELNALMKDGVDLEAQATVDKSYDKLNHKLTDDITSAIVDGGGRGVDKLIRDMEKSFANAILRPILEPISGGIASLIYPNATQAGGAAGAAGGSTSLVGAASALNNAYKVVSGGITGLTASLGSGIQTVGGWLGSSSMAEFGSGLSGSAGAAAEAMGGEMTGAASMGASMAPYAGIGMGVIGGVMGGRMISGGYGSNGAVNTGTAVGAAVGSIVPVIGTAVGALVGGLVGGLYNRAFGYKDKEITGTGMRGTLSDGIVTGQNYTDWQQKGGWFRSDKHGSDTTAFDQATINSFANGLTIVKTTVGDLAKTLNVGTEAMAGYSKNFDFLIDPLKEVKGTAAEQAAIQQENQRTMTSNASKISEFFTTVSDDLAKRLIPNMEQFSQAGETASQTLDRLSTVFKQTNAIADMLGRTAQDMFGGTGLESDAARERLVQMAGGINNLGSYTSSYSQNYLSEAEKLAPVQKAVTAAMTELGYANVKTRDEFKATVSSLDLTTESGAKTFIALMQLQDAFATVTPAIEDAKDELSGMRDELKDAYDREVDAIKSAKDAVESFSKSLKQMQDNALLGDMSNLTPEQKYAEARKQFDETAAKARAGDTDAQSQFQSSYEAFLAASRTMNASGDQYNKDFDYANDVTMSMEKWADGQASADQAALDALNAQVSGLIDIDNSVKSVTQAIKDLASAMGEDGKYVEERSQTQAIQSLYQSMLGHGASNDDMAYWKDQMSKGMTVGDIAKLITQSGEYTGKLSSQDPKATAEASTKMMLDTTTKVLEQIMGLREDQKGQTVAQILASVKASTENGNVLATAIGSAMGLIGIAKKVKPE